MIIFRYAAVLGLGLWNASCAAPLKPSPTLDAIDILRRLPNLLDYPAVYQAMATKPKLPEATSYVTINGAPEPSVIALRPGLKTRFHDVSLDEDIRFAGRVDSTANIYPPTVAVAFIDLKPREEYIRLPDLIARFGRPASSNHPTSDGRHEIPGLMNYSWTLIQSSKRRVTLRVGPISLVPTDDKIIPPLMPLAPGSGLFIPRKTDCVQFGFAIEEVRPDFHFTDIRPRLVIPPELPVSRVPVVP